MRKLLLTIVVLSTASLAFTQKSTSDGTNKKIQVGIAMGSGATFQRLGTTLAQKDGAGYNFHIGVDMNYNFAKNVGLYTGLSFDLEGFKYKFDASNRLFYNYSDKEVIRKKDLGDFSKHDSLLITNRAYKPIYLTIPTMLVFKTNQIGYLKYFGKFGLRTSFLLSQRANDNGYQSGLINSPVEQKNMKLKNDMLWVRSSVGLAGGVEWNFNGPTVLVGEIGFYYGFTNNHSQKAVGGDNERNYSFYQNDAGEAQYKSLKANQMQLLFRVAVLF